MSSASDFALTSTSLSSSSSTAASSLLSATTNSTATKGSYEIVINNAAQKEKLGSNSYSSQTSALGITGTILVNGKTVKIASTDTLKTLQSTINNLNAGVTASIIKDSSSTSRLVLTSNTEGASGISLLNGGSSDTLASLGFNGTGTVIKNAVTGGARSDSFSSSATSVETLLGNDSQNLSGTVTINGKSVAIDLSDSLQTIADNLNTAGISASIVPTTTSSTGTDSTGATTTTSKTTYQLQIEGMSSWTDSNNVLQALGVVEGNRDSQIGVKSSVANTTDGSTPITADTKITDIYGYNTNTSGDKITISGTLHDGTAATSTDFAITGSTTVGDLLTQIQNAFGNVTASMNSDGKIQVTDNTTGTSKLAVNLKSTITDPNGGVLDFGSFSAVGAVKTYTLQKGEDASFSVDGMNMTSSSNTVTDAIGGVTLNLLGGDSNTTLTLNVSTDASAIETKVNSLLTAYNNVISYVNTQMTYNSDTSTTGGPLFGDNTLKSIKSQLQNMVVSAVGTSSSIKYMSDIGITIGSDNKLTLNTSTFENALSTNYKDVVNIFADSGSSSNTDFQYSGFGSKTKAGTYAITLSQLSGSGQNIAGQIDGYDATGSGSYLTLNNSASKADGLSVLYTGTNSSATTSFTFSRGLASLLDSLTTQLTDSVNGSVTLQQNACQTGIDAMTKKISDTQTNIDQKMASLKTQFENMNSAVAQMQQMQSYLSSQLSSL